MTSSVVVKDGRTLPCFSFNAGFPGHWASELGLKRGVKVYAYSADTVYDLEGSLFQTDTTCARLKYAWCPLKLGSMPRNPYLQRRIGKLVNQHGDDGGHIQACSLGGSSNGINMVPMRSSVNRKGGAWYKMEDDARRYLSKYLSVKLIVQLHYSDLTVLRPSSFSVWLECVDCNKIVSTYMYHIDN